MRILPLGAILASLALMSVLGADASTVSAYKFQITETHASEGSDPQVTFRIETVEQYPCSNYTLPTQITIGTSTVDVSLGPAQPPNGCLTAIGPAVTAQSLPLASGSYQLTIATPVGTDAYSVVVSTGRRKD